MNYSVMPMICSISKDDEEFMISSVGSNPYFDKQIPMLRDVFHGRFEKHNVETLDGRFIKNPWMFDMHLALPVCRAVQEVDPSFIIPKWVLDVDYSKDSEFIKYRAAVDPNFVMSEWKGKTDYQKQGVLKGISQNRLAWMWEMGCGKGFVMQTTLNHLIEWGRVKKYVIICPPEGVINIALECIKFSSFGLTWEDIYIVDTAHRNPFDRPEKKLIIMTYRNLIMLHDDAYKEARKKRASKIIRKNYIPWEKLGGRLCLILDESQNIKNPGSKTWKIVDKSKVFFEFRYLLSGTPSEKYAADLWTQMRFLHEESVAGNYYDFLRSVAVLGNKYSQWAVNFYKEDSVKDFLDSVKYLVDRQKTKGNIDLPPVIFEPIRCQMPPKQELLYRSIVDQVLTVIKEQENGRVTLYRLQNKFPYLSIVLHDPCVLQEGSLANSINLSISKQLTDWDIENNGKYPIASSLIEKYANEGRKIILWSSHPKIIDALWGKFSKYKPYRLHGQTAARKGESVAERNAAVCSGFIKDRESLLLIANPDCLSTAVNLVEVTRMVFWDRPWKAIRYIQALKRSNRIGSTEPLIVNNLICFNSIEEYQDEEINRRLEFNNDLWDDGKSAEDVMDSRDILSLTEVRKILTGKAAV